MKGFNYNKKNYHTYSKAIENNNFSEPSHEPINKYQNMKSFQEKQEGPYEGPIYEEEQYVKPEGDIYMKKSYEEKNKQKKYNELIKKQNLASYKYKIIDFNYSLLEPFLSKAEKNKENIILLSTGSYNPIHKMHIEILNIAYRFLLSLKKYNILCGFISPSADCYVRSKSMPLPLIPFDLRCYMIETGIKEYNYDKKGDNLKIFLHKWEGTHDYFIDFPDVIEGIQAQILSHYQNIKLVYVCGMDLYLKCREYFSKNVIAVDRKPYKNYNYKENPEKFIYFIKDDKSQPYSSTSIRDCYLKGDYVGIKNITFPEVAEMVIKFYKNNFKGY